MIILGIDPGTARIGWGVIDDANGHLTVRAYGLITTSPDVSASERLLTLSQATDSIIAKHHPETVSVEELYFTKNVTTGIAVGQARGVILLSCAKAGIPVVSYSPSAVKRTVCGTGTAEKKQIQYMICHLLRLSQPPKPDDVADALAIAITHSFNRTLKGITK